MAQWRFCGHPQPGQSQKESERTMRQYGKVDIPQGAFIAALKVDV
jgi:GTP-binding protein LepA